MSWIALVSVKLPEVPVMVTVTVPVAADVPAVRVRALVEATGFGLNVAVTPFGNPEAESVILPENPFSGVIVMVLSPLAPPFAIVTVFGEAARLKLGTGAFTVTLTVVVLVTFPDVPVIFTATVPVAAVALAVRVRVLLLVAGSGLNAAATPLGRPDAESVTLPANPFRGLIVIVLVAAPPCVMVALPGLAERVKLGATPGQLFTRL